jgi:hypothetical protein
MGVSFAMSDANAFVPFRAKSRNCCQVDTSVKFIVLSLDFEIISLLFLIINRPSLDFTPAHWQSTDVIHQNKCFLTERDVFEESK